MANSSHLIESLKSLIIPKRRNVDQFHDNCHKSVLELAKKVKVDEIKPHTAPVQRNLNDIPSESVICNNATPRLLSNSTEWKIW